MIVVLTEEAAADLESIGDYIALDNPGRAISFVQEIVDRCERLAEMPRAYPLMLRYEHLGVRRRPFGEYLIFYRVGAEQIEILHMLRALRIMKPYCYPTMNK